MALTQQQLEHQARLQEIIDEAGPGSIVFFGGAGVSTESGIPDFRSADGLYNLKYKYPPERIISHSFFLRDPREFYRFYLDRMIYRDAAPNAAHLALAALERVGKLRSVVTQNIDGLHQAAGSTQVRELHGSVLRNYCEGCGRFYDLEGLLARAAEADDSVPRCESCGRIIKPDVVLYEEQLDERVISAALADIEAADVLIVAGTSLAVYPAAGFVHYFRGRHLVICNMSPTSLDSHAELCIAAPVGQILGGLRIEGDR